MSANAAGIGILGFGGFAMFAAQQFAQVPGVALRCIAETHRAASLACAARFGLADVQRAEMMFAQPDVQLVYIATPPFLHYAQARAALLAGKHVIVEKPLAVTNGDLLRALLVDQLAFITEPSHSRVITEDNGRESLRMSVRATQLATSS